MELYKLVPQWRAPASYVLLAALFKRSVPGKEAGHDELRQDGSLSTLNLAWIAHLLEPAVVLFRITGRHAVSYLCFLHSCRRVETSPQGMTDVCRITRGCNLRRLSASWRNDGKTHCGRAQRY